jgi:hypothetical protein
MSLSVVSASLKGKGHCNSAFLYSEGRTCAERADLKQKDHEFIMVFLVAGAGLEPATFGL